MPTRDPKKLTQDAALENIKAVARKIRDAKTVKDSIHVMVTESVPLLRQAAAAGATADDIIDVIEYLLDKDKLAANVANTPTAPPTAR